MNLTVTSGTLSTLVTLDNKRAYYGTGQAQPYTPDGTGNDVYIYDSTGKLQIQRIKIQIGVDNINVDGVTIFADANELIVALSNAFFFPSVSGGANNPNGATLLFNQEEATLADGEEIDTGFINFSAYSKQQISVVSASLGLTFVQELKASEAGSVRVTTIPLSSLETPLVTVARSTFQRLRIQNNSGAPINNVTLILKGYVGGDGATVAVLNSGLVPQSEALLTRSVLVGNPAGATNFKNVVVNPSGALLVSEYGTEVAQGKFSNVRINTVFGRNSEIDTGTTPEDVWNGGGLYTGFNCITAQRLSFASSNVADVGSAITSGTATGGNGTTIIDTGATFVSNGVVVGDLLINDSQQIHGVVASVDSETQLSVFDFSDGVAFDFLTAAGDSYRVARATSTGAAVCKFQAMLDANYDSFSEYVILNGTTAVLSVGSYLRQSRGRVIKSGTADTNQGEISGRQSITTANVTTVMPAQSGRTAICCDTVPRGKSYVIKNLAFQIARLSGAAGSANVRFQTRKRGESWQTKRFPTITEAMAYLARFEGGIIVTEFTDIKWNVQSVSDNDTVASAEFEYYEIEN
jgi:hypothetical protein